MVDGENIIPLLEFALEDGRFKTLTRVCYRKVWGSGNHLLHLCAGKVYRHAKEKRRMDVRYDMIST